MKLIITRSKKGAYASLFVDGSARVVGKTHYEFDEKEIIGLYYNFNGTLSSYIVRTGGEAPLKLPMCEGVGEIIISVGGPKAKRVEGVYVEAGKMGLELEKLKDEDWARIYLYIETEKKFNAKNIVSTIKRELEINENTGTKQR